MTATARRLGLGLGIGALTLAVLAVPTAAANLIGADRTEVNLTGQGGPAKPFRQATLTNFAALPAMTFVPASEPSGSLLGTAPVNGVTAPFADQPVQGFSGVQRNADGTYDVLSDNGYGNKANSADFVLRIQRIAPNFGSRHRRRPRWPEPDRPRPARAVRADPAGPGADRRRLRRRVDRPGQRRLVLARRRVRPVPAALRPGRSAAAGPGRRCPACGHRRTRRGASRTWAAARASRAWRAPPDGRSLYPLLEGTVAGDPPGALRLNEFDLVAGQYTGKRWTYQLESPNQRDR